MYSSFYIEYYRIKELQTFIKENTPSVRFQHNPLKTGKNILSH